MEKARLFRISMTMACRAVAGVGARKILVSTQEGPSKHARTKYNFFLCRHQTNDTLTMDVIATSDYLRYSYCFTWQEARFDAGLVV